MKSIPARASARTRRTGRIAVPAAATATAATAIASAGTGPVAQAAVVTYDPLAPDADYADLSASNVEGRIIAKNVGHGDLTTNGGEIHHAPFSATLECEEDTDPTSESPGEPTTEPASESPTGSTTGTTPGGGSTGGTSEVNGSRLATTGTALWPFIIGAAALIALGSAAAFLMRRRGTQT